MAIGKEIDGVLTLHVRQRSSNGHLFRSRAPDGPTVDIRAHKFMLISRSPVFEAMFSSKMSETEGGTEAKIRIVDINAEVFKILLAFIYCDSVSMDPESAQTLLYAAKKYLLPMLTTSCSTYLQSILNSNNVYEILEVSLTFDVDDLKRRCLRYVADHSETVLNGKELLTLSRQSLESILKMDRIMSGPSTLFQSCVKWARYQLQTQQSVEDPNDLQIREAMGSLLYEVRFPTISVTEFANLVGESNVLTTEEKSAVYYYLGSGKGKGKLKFNTENTHERLANRAKKNIKCLWPYSQCSSCINVMKSSFEFSFKTSGNILLTGLGLYAGQDRSNYPVDIQVSEENASLLQTKLIVQDTEDSITFKVSFTEPVLIVQDKVYRIIASAHKAIGYYGELCNELLVENVTFTFVSSSPTMTDVYRCAQCQVLTHMSNGCKCDTRSIFPGRQRISSAACGQIPQMYFIPIA